MQGPTTLGHACESDGVSQPFGTEPVRVVVDPVPRAGAADMDLVRVGLAGLLDDVPPELNLSEPLPTAAFSRRDERLVGYAAAADLLDHYPRATLAVLDGAGHALPHEQPDALAALLDDWLARSSTRP